jgi:CRISPR/Cas system CSM-associated protein Csm3 (group 7 of RAMP superfamily)
VKPADLRLRHHATLECVVLFDFRLICQSGLHIGAGKSVDFAGSDLPVVRDASGRPFIPGSSLRGVLRAGIESFCLSLGWNDLHKRTPVDLSAGVPDGLAKAWKDLSLVHRLFGSVEEERKKGAARGDDDSKGISYGSRLQISDATCQDTTLLEVRDGVAISRDTRTAVPGMKFDVEVVPAGTEFRGRIRFKNAADFEVGLLSQALWMLSEGVLMLGGKSSRGLGWVQVEVTTPRELSAKALLDRKPTVGSQEFGPVEEKLSAYLESLQELADFAAAAP